MADFLTNSSLQAPLKFKGQMAKWTLRPKSKNSNQKFRRKCIKNKERKNYIITDRRWESVNYFLISSKMLAVSFVRFSNACLQYLNIIFLWSWMNATGRQLFLKKAFLLDIYSVPVAVYCDKNEVFSLITGIFGSIYGPTATTALPLFLAYRTNILTFPSPPTEPKPSFASTTWQL